MFLHAVRQRFAADVQVLRGMGVIPLELFQRLQDQLLLDHFRLIPCAGRSMFMVSTEGYSRCRNGGRSEGLISSPAVSTTNRSMMFSSSRMLPGYR